jgi:hypothetical protein
MTFITCYNSHPYSSNQAGNAIYTIPRLQRSSPLPNSSIRTTPSRVPPAKVGVLGGILPDQLFVHLDAEARSGQQLHGSVLDVKDLGILQVGEQVKVTGIVMHLQTARGRIRRWTLCTNPRRLTFQLISQMTKLGVEKAICNEAANAMGPRGQ